LAGACDCYVTCVHCVACVAAQVTGALLLAAVTSRRCHSKPLACRASQWTERRRSHVSVLSVFQSLCAVVVTGSLNDLITAGRLTSRVTRQRITTLADLRCRVDESETVTESSFTSRSTRCRYSRDRVFPSSHSHWYWLTTKTNRLAQHEKLYNYQIVIPFHSIYTTWTIVVVFFFCLAISFLLFGHFCMFCIFRYLCVTVYIQLFSFRAASVCLFNKLSWQLSWIRLKCGRDNTAGNRATMNGRRHPRQL